MKETRKYLAWLLVDGLAASACGKMMAEAIKSEDTNAIAGAAIVDVLAFVSVMYVGQGLSENMGIEVGKKIDELKEKRRLKKKDKEDKFYHTGPYAKYKVYKKAE